MEQVKEEKRQKLEA